MKTVDLNRPNENGNYYEFAIIATGDKEIPNLKADDKYEIIRFTNYGCTACIERYIEENYRIINKYYSWRTYKTFFNGTNPEIDLNNIPKKYQKLFKKTY